MYTRVSVLSVDVKNYSKESREYNVEYVEYNKWKHEYTFGMNTHLRVLYIRDEYNTTQYPKKVLPH